MYAWCNHCVVMCLDWILAAQSQDADVSSSLSWRPVTSRAPSYTAPLLTNGPQIQALHLIVRNPNFVALRDAASLHHETYCKSFAHLLAHDTTYAQCVARHMFSTIWWVNGSRESVRQTTRFAAEYFHHAQFFVALTYSNTTWRGVFNPARRGAKFVWRGNPRAMSFAIDNIMEM